MALPKKLKYFNYFVNGNNFVGQVQEVTLPKLTVKTEDYQGGGMPGSVAIDLGLDAGALDMEVIMGGITPEFLKQWGEPTADGLQHRFAGSYQAEDTGKAIPAEVQTRGRWIEQELSAAKQGEDTDQKYTLKNTYYRLTIDGEEVIEIDVLNMIYKVRGKDMLKQHRSNIGL